MPQTVAGIVIYKPEHSVLSKLVKSIASECSAIIIIANSSISAKEHTKLQNTAKKTPIIIDNNGENIGLGGAYERIMTFAQLKNNFGYIERVILFDQDSSPAPGMISALNIRMNLLQYLGERPAVVGPKPIAATPSHKTPTIHHHGSLRNIASSQAVWFTISSGSLIDLAAYRKTGSFRSDFFIDGIDIEWCLRAWSKGYSCWSTEDILMPHRLGTGHITVPLFGWKLPIQSPLRLSTYARNQAALLRMHHVPKSWKFRICGYLALQALVYWLADGGQTARPKSMIAGFAAGITGRLGPPPDILHARQVRNHATTHTKEAT